MQRELLTHSSNSKLIVVENSGHRIQTERPEVVIAAIRDVVEKSRKPYSQSIPASQSHRIVDAVPIL